MTICKLVLIAGFAAAFVSIGDTEEASNVVIETIAPQTAPQLCTTANRLMSRAIGATYKSYLDQTPVSYIAQCNG